MEVIISSWVLKKVWGGMHKVLLPKYCRDVCTVVNRPADILTRVSRSDQ